MTYLAQIGSSKLGWYTLSGAPSLDAVRTWARQLLAEHPEFIGSNLDIYRNGPVASDYAYRRIVATI